MTQRVGIVVVAFLSAGLLFAAVAPAQQADRRSEVVRALLQHERLMSGAHVEIPVSLYHQYLRDLNAPDRGRPEATVPYIAESGTYYLAVGAEGQTTLKAEVRLRVFDPMRTRNLPVLSAKAAWEDLTVNDKPVKLATVGDWLRFTSSPADGPLGAGLYTITAKLRLETTGSAGGMVILNVPETIKTFVVFDSPAVWEVQTGQEQFPHLIGTGGKGTHGRLALTPGKKLQVEYRPPMPLRDRPPQYSLQGDVAWNLDAGAQQITASLTATVASGASDQIVLLLPDEADRVEITGPEVRRVEVGSGRAVVHLRGKILGQTVLKVSCELPAGKGSKRRLDRFGAADGRWTGGTLVITNSAGGSEVIPETMMGLREMSPAEIPPSASAILPAPAVMAYEITSRAFSAEVEVLQLGEFALRQSIADLAHYEVFLARDGSVICRARYEIRNSNKQFLNLKLPAGAQVLLARVNEKSRPISPATGEKNTWLLPLERSRASVMGLVSFPVEVVFLCRTAPMGEGGVAEIPLPAIDLPIAYGWCETYVPAGMEVKQWSGAMRKVVRFSSETATASLDYGWGELAEGYTKKDRPTTPPAPKPSHGFVGGGLLKPPAALMTPTYGPTTRPAALQPSSQPTDVVEREMGVPILSKIPVLNRITTNRAIVRDDITLKIPTASILAKNYYRAGKDYYDKNEFAESARYLEQVAKLAPGSTEAHNAERLLANPQMPSAMKLSTGAEKAAARVVEREVAESNVTQVFQQMAYIKAGQAAVHEGQYKQAEANLKAAQSATEQLIARGADRQETVARMQQAQPELQKLSEQTAGKVSELRKQMSELKEAGKYDEALKTAGKLQRYGFSQFEAYDTDKRDSRIAELRRKESQELQKEMDALAAAASRERQGKGKGGGGGVPTAGATVSRLPGRPTTKRTEESGLKTSSDAAAQVRLKSLQVDIDRAKAAIADGEKAMDADQVARAIAYFEQAVKIAPQYKPGHERLAFARSLVGTGGHLAATSRLERVRSVRKQETEVRYAERAADQTKEIEQSKRLIEVESNRRKAEKIATLKVRADTLRNEQKYKQAIEIYGEISKLDPNDDQAKDWLAQMERFVQLLDAREADRTSMREEAKQLNDVRWSQVQSRMLMNLPDDWPDKTLKRKPMGAGEITESKENRAARQRLMQTLPRLDFSGIAFGDVVQFLREVSNVSIHVKWNALEAVGVNQSTKVNVHLTNVTLSKAIRTILEDVGGATPLAFVVDEGVITISTMDDLSRQAVTRVYDIRDLVVRTPDFKGPNISLRSAGNNANNDGGWTWGDDDDNDKEDASSRQKLTGDIVNLIRSAIDPDTWGEDGGKHASIREKGGQIIVTQTAENQQALTDLLAQLRQARGPQVEEGEKIAQQRAGGKSLDDVQAELVDAAKKPSWGTGDSDTDTWGGADPITGARLQTEDGARLQIEDKELREFVRRNYDWKLEDIPQTGARIPNVPEIVSKLRFNLGQKVTVNSLNVNADARAAAALGVQFNRGGNNVNWAVVNEAQFRSLMELDAELTRRSGRAVEANGRLQETIVGTDAYLANGMIANIAFAGDKGNSLDISGNSINLAHEGYVIVDNGGFLTVIQAGAMQHWQERPVVVQFAEIPQNIETPRVGQLFRFERTLLEPSDQMVLRAEYKWKGVSQ